ncbi:phosphosulfolactate synthase [Luteibaculum oceani]|uniref:Phosphosulfolactate synthase n=1 Tax=Luteibaculum oceani TaxID=1294296 RepID=A0A5C6V225_9FLAO|nr:phosphosulfolactate synthase [Luteibaculum oceani]TXC77085.1 phosphosulfolactate synthase [Luteibaculum oceani]
MNHDIAHLPERTAMPRKDGLTMVMDKGLSVRQAEDLIEGSKGIVDIVKLGFGSSLITPNLKEKIDFYKSNNVRVYFGGTLFEAFIARNDFDGYRAFIDKYQLDLCEVSDGSILISTDAKCEYIHQLAKDYTVLSEVGSKEEGILISPNKWIKMMTTELEAGSWKVIAEARESGTVGIYRPNGSAHSVLINKILNKVKAENIIWEAPKKAQQVYFIKLIGANVNLGNIATDEAIALECLRLGLRGDTFFQWLPEELSEKLIQKNDKE